MLNRRRLFRVRIKGFEQATMINYANEKSTYNIILINISGNGLSFMSRKKFPISNYNKYTFMFELEGEKFELEGYIVRNSFKEEDRYIKYGVKLISLSTKKESELIRRINRYQSRHYRDNILEDQRY
ncbi:PilZ domain-containing protein [Marinilactibacillus psychrotolerans]|uniref:PilZ domain-containing protein n=1 Tax=Marinilactibacillus psychrotolerans TaxID=191770 RepID=A0A511H2H2_9LACT|nr:PilZ domain-containing protein [Marinilactibacillus psychrotolerans]TLQ05585.1 PilZ domain-containing protein [Marinilactibacillus psychrotolerans]SDD05557.1 PilZ domain-containing protein [Marinilactibacillus psychrotolerans]GEL67727.1 hypothetical protein MPS01_18820 [Marinilactibacillus psychrotolerans]GEQ32832.1 hypothetical protein B795N_07140 [Marinilactibacillus psychrotolerans]GEQ36498.1 hypothetical protein M132T_20060 [Marinilactibacillus psychrotolerans]